MRPYFFPPNLWHRIGLDPGEERRMRKAGRMRKAILLLLLISISARPLFAQTAPEGIWQGYDGEWKHVSKQLIDLAEATPGGKFSWRPAPGVRSTVDGMYLRIIVHANEHMGQLVAYARMTGVAPPWSKTE